MKVQVVPDLDLRWGGTSVSVPALTRAMHELDPSVGLYFAADDRSPDWPDYFHPFGKSWPRSIHASSALRAALQAGRWSVVHHHALWLPSLGYAHRAAVRCGCPLVVSPRGMLSPYALRRQRWKKRLARWLLHPGALAGVTAWHATSDLEADEIRVAGFSQPIVVAANGIVPPQWREPADREAWLAQHPELRGRRIVLFFSRLHSKKGVYPLLEWWRELAPRHGDWHLLVAGTPHEHTFADVAARAAALGIGHRVTVADPRSLAKPYPLAELYVLPTRSENFGLTVGEALISGVPVLTTTDAPWRQLNDLGCGACVPWDEFAARLNELLTLDSAHLRGMGQAGRQWIEREFSWRRTARELLDFYATLSR